MKHYPHPEGVKLDNLLKMADYIENVPQDAFNMGFYRTGNEHKHNCDSIGCIIGHCVILDSFTNIPFYHDVFGIYCIDFDLWSQQYTGIRSYSMSWRYLFSPEWSYRPTDNTPKGAAKRIRYYVKNGLPENWYLQITGREPLSYNQ